MAAWAMAEWCTQILIMRICVGMKSSLWQTTAEHGIGSLALPPFTFEKTVHYAYTRNFQDFESSTRT